VVQSGLPANNSGLRFFIPAPIAEYRFEQGTLTGAAGEVLDSSGNGHHGTRINAPANGNKAQTTASGRICRGIDIPANNNLNQIDGVDTGLPTATVGPRGAITFWYRSTAAWGGNNHILFDASTIANRHFYLVRDNNSRLRFVVTDNANAPATMTLVQGGAPVVPAGTWKHLAVTWRLAAGANASAIAIYSDGALVASQTGTTNGVLHSSLGALLLGDNRSGNFQLGNATRSASGTLDEVRVYNYEATAAVVQRDMRLTRACGSLDHFAIGHPGTAVTCEPATVTFSAHQSDHSVSIAYTGTVNLSTSSGRGDWSLVSGAGVLANGGADDGAGSYTFAAADNGVVQLGLKHTAPATLDLDADDGSASDSSGSVTAAEDATLEFVETGFVLLADGVAGAIGNQIAGKATNQAPGAQALELRAVRASDSTGACEAALTGTQSIELAFECVDPNACAGGTMAVTAATAAAIPGNPGGAVAIYAPVSFDFAAGTGRAPFLAQYSDAGNTRLHARFDLPLGSGGASGDLMRGASNAFTWRPFALQVTAAGNPGASGASGPRYRRAGEAFTTAVRAVAWSALDDTDADGIADGHAAGDIDPSNNASLADNATTPNFSPSAAAALAARLLAPAPGVDPGLSGTTTVLIGGGVGSTAGARYDEVGIVEVSAAQTGDYLGIGPAETARIRGHSGFVGRFHPARFEVTANVPAFADACAAGAFTYLDQTFHFATAPVLTVTARNLGGGVTRNYTSGGFWKLDTVLAGRGYLDASGAGVGFTAMPAGPVALAGDTGLTGSATLSVAGGAAGDGFQYRRTALVAPFNARVDANFPAADLTDSDGVCVDADVNGVCEPFLITAIGTTALRFGRLTLASALGSELLPLTMPARAEHYTGTVFVQNLDDACTSLALAAEVTLANPQTADGAPQPGTQTMTIAAGSTRIQSGDLGLAAGAGAFVFTPPGANQTGYVDTVARLNAAAPWLRYDWDGGGAYDDDPTARASFGIYNGPHPFIYLREPW
jgi:MSHA biogenesis protein MshQ